LLQKGKKIFLALAPPSPFERKASWGRFTHPDIASLVDPLSASGKRVRKILFSSSPLFAQAERGWGELPHKLCFIFFIN
jgi:hypothetical protein